MSEINWTAKILNIDNSNPDRVDFTISKNADKSSTFIASVPALEANKTVQELAMWAYAEWQKKQDPVINTEG